MSSQRSVRCMTKYWHSLLTHNVNNYENLVYYFLPFWQTRHRKINHKMVHLITYWESSPAESMHSLPSICTILESSATYTINAFNSSIGLNSTSCLCVVGTCQDLTRRTREIQIPRLKFLNVIPEMRIQISKNFFWSISLLK